MSLEYYEALGLAPMLSLDAEDLKRRFYERSRQWHPDRFARRGPEQQKMAMDMTAALNDGFRTLRDPVSRAEYFLEQQGMPPTKTPPPELLEEVFELNMALEELRGGDASVRPQLDDARKRFLGMRSEIDQSLAGLFARYDASKEAEGMDQIRATGGFIEAPLLGDIRAALDRRLYISNLLRDVEKELRGGATEERGTESPINV